MLRWLFPLFLLIALTAPGQEFRASIVGRVSDSSGAVVPNAQVTATNLDTAIAVKTQTTATGDYVLTALQPGNYRLEVELAGFKKHVRDGITLNIQERPAIDVTLETGDIATSVTVSAEASQLEVSNASRGELITGKVLVDLPLNGRNAFALASLAPGVALTVRGQASTFLRPTANNGISGMALSGGQPRQNEVLLDGVPNTGSDGLIQFVPSVDAAQEFKVQTNSFDAEFGRFTGGVINAMIKSGTNELHGAAFEFLRNSAFNARDPFAATIPQFGYNLYGFSVGGPVVLPKIYNGRNRTFWFFNYEGSREGVPRAFVSTVPTALQRQGDFSDTNIRLSNGQPGPVTVYDPATTAQQGGTWNRQAFPGNRIPVNRWDPVARNLINLFPLPNHPGDSITGANNYRLSFKDTTGDDGWVVKVDHRFSDRHSVFGRFSTRSWFVTRAGNFRNELTGDRETRDAPGFAFDDTYTLSPTAVLNFRYGFTRFFITQRSDNLGTDLAALGFPASFASSVGVAAIPTIGISGYTTISGMNKLNRSAEDTHTVRGGLTKNVGRQTFKFGAEWRLLRSNIGSRGSAAAGNFSFNTVFTRGPNPQVANVQSGFGLASFLLGLGASGSIVDNAATADQMPYYGFYVQDDIRVSRKLTVNLGLRYELEGAYTERYDRLNRGFDTTTDLPISAEARARYAQNPIPDVSPANFQVRGGLLFAGVGGQPRSIANLDRNNFAPRIGVAYQIDSKTVLRGGYGMFYGAGTLSGEARNGFSVTTPFVGTIDGGLTPVNRLSNPFPNGFNQPAGASEGLMTLTGQGIGITDPNRRQPMAQQYAINIQHEFGWSTLAEIGYVGANTRDVAVNQQLNAIPAAVRDEAERVFRETGRNFLNNSAVNPFRGLITGGVLTGANTTRGQLSRPFPHFTSVSSGATPLGKIRYDSLQAKMTKRLSHGLTMIGAFTWMKQLDQLRFLNEQDTQLVKEISDFDYDKRFTMSGTYELPFGRGRAFLQNMTGVTRALLEGWQFNAIYTAQGGVPIGVGNAQSIGRSAKLDNPTVGRWFDISAFRQQETLELNITDRLPDVRSAGKNTWDISMFKTTTITERVRLQFRVESFNTFNRPEWSSPGTGFGSPNFGVVTSTNTFARQLQFGLKLLW